MLGFGSHWAEGQRSRGCPSYKGDFGFSSMWGKESGAVSAMGYV